MVSWRMRNVSLHGCGVGVYMYEDDKTSLALSQYNILTMDLLLGLAHSDAWTTQLKSNALLITIVLFAVVVYVAATSGSYPRRRRPRVRKPIPFAKIVQVNENSKVRACIKRIVVSDRCLVHLISWF